jgi:hypothetical protein
MSHLVIVKTLVPAKRVDAISDWVGFNEISLRT